MAKEHILIVEDEAHLATGLKYNLTAEGYRVTIVPDGPSALRLFESNPESIDLLILDLMLPGLSGYAVCEAIRARDPDVPVMILSARTLPEDRARGFDMGANQYLTKPFDLDEFLSRVRNLLAFHSRAARRANRPAQRSDRYQFGKAQIDFSTFEVRVGGEEVRLTQLEMALLRYFVENEGRVVPRGELLERVWGVPATINTRAVDQFIRRLRKTFEPDPGQPRFFLTIRDVGYRFVASGVEPAEEADAPHDDYEGDEEDAAAESPGGSLRGSPGLLGGLPGGDEAPTSDATTQDVTTADDITRDHTASDDTARPGDDRAAGKIQRGPRADVPSGASRRASKRPNAQP